MAQRLFSVNKVPIVLDDYTPGTERRRGETVKVLTLSLRVMPLDAKLAHAIDDGINDDAGVKDALFKISNGEPKKHRTRVNFNLNCSRQNLITFASTDTPTSRMAFNQCRIFGEYARTSKDVNAYAFVFKASFGPVSRDEMEFVHAWLGTQMAVTFEESEEQFEFEGDDEGADENAPAPRPKPMWDEADDVLATGRETTHGADGPSVVDKAREKAHRYPKKAKKAKKR